MGIIKRIQRTQTANIGGQTLLSSAFRKCVMIAAFVSAGD